MAKFGAEIKGIETISFIDSSEIKYSPYNVLVGSVEMLKKYFELNGLKVPSAIPLDVFPSKILGRNIDVAHSTNLNILTNYPYFIKPANDIKAFTGMVVNDIDDYKMFSNNYQGDVYVQEVVNIVSEWRVYIEKSQIRGHEIIGCKHYSGDDLIFPNKQFIEKVFKHLIDELPNYNSFTIDIGILDDGKNIVVEANDAWAIGNYGLDAEIYYNFIRKRFFQITNLLK